MNTPKLDEAALEAAEVAYWTWFSRGENRPIAAIITAYLTALPSSEYRRGVEDEGWVLVPREPTPEMMRAGHLFDPLGCDVPDEERDMIYDRIWFGMVGAAPEPPK